MAFAGQRDKAMQQPLVQRRMIEIGQRQAAGDDERIGLVVVEAGDEQRHKLRERDESRESDDETGVRRRRAIRRRGRNQRRRSAIIVLICEIALAGLRPLGQVLAQFMIVWQR